MRDSELSGREREILGLVAEGLTNREIAQALTISHNTVKVHLSNVFEKLGVASRTEATAYAIEHRIVEVPGGEATALNPQEQTLGQLLRRFTWFWVALGMLIVLGAISLSSNLLAANQSSELLAGTDVAERWQELAPLPEPRARMAAVSYSGEIYIIGGEGPDGVSGKGFRYLPESDEWLPIADKPTPVSDVAGVVIGEKVYIPGGKTLSGAPTAVLEVYDPRQDTWEEGTPLPEALSAYALADFEGQLYLFGGWDCERARDAVWVYEPVQAEWRAGAPMAEPTYDLAAVALTDRIVVLGGRGESQPSAAVWSYYPSRDIAGGTPWERFVDLPEPRYGFGAAGIFNSIYILGGHLEGRGESGIVLGSETWVAMPVIEEYTGRDVDVVTLGSDLFVIEHGQALEQTKAWRYQVYYTIYIPFLP